MTVLINTVCWRWFNYSVNPPSYRTVQVLLARKNAQALFLDLSWVGQPAASTESTEDPLTYFSKSLRSGARVEAPAESVAGRKRTCPVSSCSTLSAHCMCSVTFSFPQQRLILQKLLLLHSSLKILTPHFQQLIQREKVHAVRKKTTITQTQKSHTIPVLVMYVISFLLQRKRDSGYRSG